MEVKNRNNLLGLILVLIGAIWLISNMSYIDLDFQSLIIYLDNLVEIWPLILIVIGSFLITRKKSKRILVIILAILVLISYTAFGPDIIQGIQNLIINGI